MTSRERVMAALSLREPDRIPIDLGQAGGDGITIKAYENLIGYLGLPARQIRIQNRAAQTAQVDEDVLQRFHVDTRRLDLGSPDCRQEKNVGENSYIDEWGLVRKRPEHGFYYDIVSSPMAKMDTGTAIEQFPWPDPHDPGRFRGLKEAAKDLHENSDYAVILQVNCTFFLRCGELRGWENFYMDLAAEPEFASALMNRYLDFKLAIAERALDEVEENVDVVYCLSDDLGMSDRTIVSPEMYRELIKPIQKRLFDFFKARTPAKRFYHCDGAVYPIIGDFIEIGTEAFNPIQVSAAGMNDTKRLKREFGDRLAFWGAIDTYTIMPFGTVEDVRREVSERIHDLGPGGGYVLCAVHNIQPDVPPENVVAMYETAYEMGRYPLESRQTLP
ncbi:MAG: hypothetical protein JSV89_12970 [Spirochaetaceae bacterium]|nr:MAG: hypothetical protein JSV89_12970 [Spirochaetaceae bacterium]